MRFSFIDQDSHITPLNVDDYIRMAHKKGLIEKGGDIIWAKNGKKSLTAFIESDCAPDEYGVGFTPPEVKNGLYFLGFYHWFTRDA